MTVRNCTFNGSPAGEPAVRLRNTGNVTITGNIIENAVHNGILLESNNSVKNDVAKTINITGNTICNWNSGSIDGGGRAMRLSLGSDNTLFAGSVVNITDNTFIKAALGKDKPDFLKITGAGAAPVDISNNYWSGKKTTSEIDGSVYTTDTTGAVTLTSVKNVCAVSDSVTLAEAAAAATSGDTIKIAAGTYDITADNLLYKFKASVTFEGAVDVSGKPSTVFNVTLTGSGGLSIEDGATLKNMKFNVTSVGTNAEVFSAYNAFTMDNCEVVLSAGSADTADCAYVFDMTTNLKAASITNCVFTDNTTGTAPTWVVGFPYANRYTSTEKFTFNKNTVTGRWNCGVIDLLAGSYEVKNNTVNVTGNPNTIFGIAVTPNMNSGTAYTSTITGNNVTKGNVFIRYIPIDNTNKISTSPTDLTLIEIVKPTVTVNTVNDGMTPCDICLARTHNCYAKLTLSGTQPFATGSDITTYTESRQIATGFVYAWQAAIGTTKYPTLAEAVTAAQTSDTIKLLANVTEDITIPSGKTMTLDLNGKTLTGVTDADVAHNNSAEYKAVITNNGTLTVVDTASGGAITDASPYFKKATIYNTSTGTLNLLGGTVSKGTAGAYYVLLNHGTATINGATVQSADTKTSAILNGYSTSAWETIPTDSNTKIATMTISSGTVTGGRYAVKNGEAYAKLEITGGTFSKGASDAAAIINYSNCEATISGGTFAADGAKDVISCKARTNTNGAGTLGLSVTGGSFSGAISVADGQKLSVSGGYFTTDPSAYVVSDKIVGTSDKTGYTYMVKAVEANVKVDVGNTVTNPVPSDAPEMTNDDKTALEAVTVAPDTNDKGLATAGGNVATTITQQDKAAATDELKTAGVTTDGATVTVVVQPKLVVTPQSYVSEDKELTLDIKAVYDEIATTAAEPSQINTTGAVGTKNATVTKENQPMTVPDGTPVVIKVAIPAAMATETSAGSGTYNSLNIKHVKEDGITTYYYTANVTKEAEVYYATFTVTHGFSTFTLMTADTRKLAVTYDSGIAQGNYSITDVGTTLPVPTKAGYTFTGWKFTDPFGEFGVYTKLTNDLWSAVMNGITAGDTRNINATAQFAAIPVSGGTTDKYTLSFETNGGSAVKAVTAEKNAVIDLTKYAPTKEGYDFSGWYSDSKLTTAVTSVTMTKDITVYAKWTEKSQTAKLPFTDVPETAYYRDAVAWAVEKDVTSGVTATTFAPDRVCTRAETVTFLWRAMGSPEPAAANNPFTDVSANDYYYKAVLWAVEKGITKGASDTTFSPAAPVTRAQTVTFLWRAAGMLAQSGSNPFTDVQTGAFYTDAVLWAGSEGITEGTGTTTFSPNLGCTRAQIVTFLYRYLAK